MTKTKLNGPFETGAHDAETNDFILTAVNTKILHAMVMRGSHPEKIFNGGRHSVFKHIKHPALIDFDVAREYFEDRRKEMEKYNQEEASNMPKSKHTPGPWRIDCSFDWVYSGRYQIAMVTDIDGSRCCSDRTEANAKLIAAAPDLYAFVRAILVEQENQGEHGDAELISRARKILHKIDSMESK